MVTQRFFVPTLLVDDGKRHCSNIGNTVSRYSPANTVIPTSGLLKSQRCFSMVVQYCTNVGTAIVPTLETLEFEARLKVLIQGWYPNMPNVVMIVLVGRLSVSGIANDGRVSYTIVDYQYWRYYSGKYPTLDTRVRPTVCQRRRRVCTSAWVI